MMLANYDGVATVSSNNLTVDIKRNEGTVIKNNGAPSDPITLLKPPEFMTNMSDTAIYTDQFNLVFKPVQNARRYNVVTSSSNKFDNDVSVYKTNKTVLTLRDLQLGITYVHVQSVDSLGLRGPFGRVYRIIRNKDDQPPPHFLG